MTIIDYIQMFNEQGFEGTLIKVFNNLKSFLRVVAKKEKQAEIDLELLDYEDFKENDNLFLFLDQNGFLQNTDYDSFASVAKNYFLEYWIDKDPDAALKYICDNILTDVEVRPDGFWLRLSSRGELYNFYDTGGRDHNPREIAKEIFSEDGLDIVFGRYWDTTDDVYGDVIDNLDIANIEVLANYILKTIGNQDLNIEEYSSEFFHELAEIQARNPFFQITSDNVHDLIKDEEAMKEFLKDDLSDLKSELYAIHSNAYSNAYESEIYEAVYDGLDEFFSSKIDEQETKKGDKVRYVPYIRIKHLKHDVMTFINQNQGYDYSGSKLEYWGSYTSMVSELISNDTIDGIDFRIPDYADWDLTRKYINEFFTDYI